MTEQEALKILKQLKKGKKFGTRYKADEWGVKYTSDNKYEKWTRIVEVFTNEQGNKDLCQNYVKKEIAADKLIDLLCKYYEYDDIYSKLKK